MNSFILDSETLIRLTVFMLVFVLLAVAELCWPRRPLSVSKSRRWMTNLTLSVINSVCVRFVIPLAGISYALILEERGVGLFNITALPLWFEFILFVLIFDLGIYWQHRLYHIVPLLWRLHRVHHTDRDYDLTTGNRFHPLSILLSALVKLLLVFVFGPAALALLTAEVLLNVTSMFNHSNLKLPASLDRGLRYLIVTPDMHRIHHSIDEGEHNRNFGFNLSCWDRFFGTYWQQPALSQEAMPIGIRGFEDESSWRLPSLLMQPFKASKSERA